MAKLFKIPRNVQRAKGQVQTAAATVAVLDRDGRVLETWITHSDLAEGIALPPNATHLRVDAGEVRNLHFTR